MLRRTFAAPTEPLDLVARRRALLVAASAGLVTLVLLLTMVDHDPAPGMTWSNAPYTDEGFNVVNARNQVLLGRWSTDEWRRELTSAPFILLEAAMFGLAGVGMVQARLLVILATAATAALLSWWVARRAGPTAGLVAGAGYGLCGLVLYYGRLTFLEPVVDLWLVAALILATGRATRRASIAAGALLGLALLTKLSAAAPIAGLVVGLALTRWQARRPVRGPLQILLLGFGAVIGIWAVIAATSWPAAVAMLQTLPPDMVPQDAAALLQRVSTFLSWESDGAPDYLLPFASLALVAVMVHLSGRPASASPVLVIGSCWAVAAVASLLPVAYRPNRYLVLAVPGLAMIAAWAAAAIVDAFQGPRRATLRLLAGSLSVAVVTVPGLLLVPVWWRVEGRQLLALQDRVASDVPPGAVMAGEYAATLGLRAPVVTVIPWIPAAINDGDLYADLGVRWLAQRPGVVPAWSAAHADAWAARRLVWCEPWGAAGVCLLELP